MRRVSGGKKSHGSFGGASVFRNGFKICGRSKTERFRYGAWHAQKRAGHYARLFAAWEMTSNEEKPHGVDIDYV